MMARGLKFRIFFGDVPQRPSGLFISQLIRFARVFSYVTLIFVTAEMLIKVIGIINTTKHFSYFTVDTLN